MNTCRQIYTDFDDFKESLESYINLGMDCLNTFVQVSVWIDYFYSDPILEEQYIKGLYAFACFMIWIKIYGLMRIFSSYAHFITIISEIVREI